MRIAALGAGLLLSVTLVAGPADAHGALESPLSRAAACGETSVRSAACRAAQKTTGSALPKEWDNLRVSNVAGRDRQMIPDGKLCSGGLPEFRGLDLARRDWPATTVKPGVQFTFKYRGTIPHKGTFRFYVTKKGYDPAGPLKWSDLEGKPFLQAKDPKLVDGAYLIKGRMPTGRTGRHLIYTIWQNSDTPDTYYSCSDVIFSSAAAANRARPAAALQVSATSSSSSSVPWPVGVAALLGVGTGAAVITGLRAGRRRRRLDS
ncbi:lytic polysaccharide monooxygenase auxiliary activity family 9 protein [Nonomuraea sp. SYSU D8015]|uniref:lytic polysaccharide monooxygenase auxiliary activity family 9 protein n=1 Tax=Nonomuraea sp. SYSU D8015 TaxID=2593644 RepID=UPI0016609D26|nr:lytic polysaccharide monooxygenase [Nonomuraea sp. SYSU D8015]